MQFEFHRIPNEYIWCKMLCNFFSIFIAVIGLHLVSFVTSCSHFSVLSKSNTRINPFTMDIGLHDFNQL
uniref:Uncharacterized protein n=1 Tax=Arundo donax TaxID=35708 RepID=A0A0A8XVX8_ARUDO